MAYEFHYTPTGTGVISGKEVLEQTEDAINDLGNTAISGVQEALDKAEQALTNSENAVDDAQTALNTANNAEGVAIQAQNDVSNLSGTVTNIGNRVTTAEGNITNLQGRMTTAEGNIGNLQGRMTTAETNIGNLQTAVSTAQATANSAQQTATTARQQSYVFRYSSTALVASSTNSNTLLDNTDNLKVGDKVIDSSGVLFSITAIDTVNSTFTIGSALIDLALDANVVHLSGSETITGAKYFNGIIYSIGGIQTRLNTQVSSGESSSKSWAFIDNAYKNLFKLVVSTNTDKSTRVEHIIYNVDSNNTETLNRITWRFDNNSSVSELRPTDNAIKLGTNLYRWSEVYATNYYYGSNNVEFSTKFVTTDTAQTISGAKTFEGVDLKLKSVAGEYAVSGGSNSLLFYDKNSLLLSLYKLGVYGSGLSYQVFSILGYDSNNQQVNKSITFSSSYLDLSTAFLKPDTDNAIALGRNNYKWSDVQTYKVNALEPSSLSLPSGNVSNVIDISSYITALDGTSNSYTVPANGWISIAITGTAIAIVSSSWSDSRLRESSGNVRMLYPVLKNETLDISVTGTTLAYARFIPCQGNV